MENGVKKTIKRLFSLFLVSLIIVSCEKIQDDIKDYIAPGEVSDLYVISADRNAIVTWNIPNDEDYAGVEISCEPAAGTLINPVILGKNVKSISLSGFEIGKTYIFKVRTFDTNLNYSNGVTIESTVDDTNDYISPGEVCDFNVISADGNAVATWNIPNDEDYAGVEISCEPAAGTLSTPIILGENTKSISLSGFEIGKTYVFKARTFDTNLNYSNGVTIESTVIDTADYDAPGEVSDLFFENLDEAVKVSWVDPDNEDLFGIEITYLGITQSRTAYTMPENSIIVAPNTCYAIINNLQNGLNYSFVVRTIDLCGNKSNGIMINLTPSEIKKCIVIFKTDNNPLYKREILVINNKVQRPENPEIVGYIFKGWFEDEDFKKEFDFEKPISHDTYVYAKFIEDVRYTVSFDTIGGTTIDDLSILNGQTISVVPSVPEKEMSVFQGWYTSENYDIEYDFSLPVIKNITLYAKWIPVYTITFETNGGSSVSPQFIQSGCCAVSPAENPTKYKYVFMGWFTTDDLKTEFNFEAEISSDTKVYAKWEDVLVVEGSKGLDYEMTEEPYYLLIDDCYYEFTRKICTITGIGECTDSIVYIPKSIDGGDVTAIAELAFENCTSVTKFVISSTVQSIGDRAFKNCYGITEITVPENVTTIGDQIFYNCTSLETIYCNSSAGRQSMWQNPSVKKVIFGDNLTSIPDSFRNCTNIEYVRLSKNTHDIGAYTFDGCINLGNIDFPEGISDLGWYAFEDCKFTKFIIPSSVTRLDNVVRTLPYLEYIIAPITLRYVLGQSFDGTYTGYKTFYLGTETDWNYISISEESTFGNDVYFHSETQPEESGKYWHYNSKGEPEIWE